MQNNKIKNHLISEVYDSYISFYFEKVNNNHVTILLSIIDFYYQIMLETNGYCDLMPNHRRDFLKELDRIRKLLKQNPTNYQHIINSLEKMTIRGNAFEKLVVDFKNLIFGFSPISTSIIDYVPGGLIGYVYQISFSEIEFEKTKSVLESYKLIRNKIKQNIFKRKIIEEISKVVVFEPDIKYFNQEVKEAIENSDLSKKIANHYQETSSDIYFELDSCHFEMAYNCLDFLMPGETTDMIRKEIITYQKIV